MSFDKKLKELKKTQSQRPNRILSMYLNTDPSDPGQQAGEWQIHLKNGLNNFESYLDQSGDKEEFQNFKSVREKVENFIHIHEQEFKKGIILFANADESVWFAEKFQMPLENAFYWEDTAVTDQLEKLQEEFPKSGIILTQQNQIKVIEAELGEILETKFYELDLETEDWREKSSSQKTPISGRGKGTDDTAYDSFSARVSANQQRWYKSIAPKLDKLAKDNNWERIYLVGDKQETETLKEKMNKEIFKMEEKNLLNHEETEVVEKVIV